MQQAATEACDFVDGMVKEDFLADKRTQQAVIMSLIIVGEAATKLMHRYLHLRSSSNTVAQYARHAQSYCARLF